MVKAIFPAFFALACGLTMWRAWKIANPRRVVMSFIMVAIWAGANIAWLYNMLWTFPVMNMLAGMLVFMFWIEEHSKWAFGLWLVFCFRLAGDVFAELAGASDLTGYLNYNNALFALGLWLIGREKGRKNDRNALLHWLRAVGRVLSSPPKGGMSRGH